MRHFVCAAALAVWPALTVLHAQEKVVPTPANVKVDGMPSIPQAIFDGVARYGQFRQAQMIGWHPTKRQVLITTTFTNPQLHLVDGPLRDRRQLTWVAGGVPVLADAAFDPADGNTLVFSYDPGGTERRSLYRYDLTTGLSTLAVQAQSRYPPLWSRQGKWLVYDSAERNGKDIDLYVVQPTDPSTKRRLADFEGPWSPQDWSPDGSTLLVNEVVANDENYLWRVDVKSGEKTPITKRGDGIKAAWVNARFSADGRRVYAISDRGGDSRVWRCDVAKCAWTPVTADGVVVDAVGGLHGTAGFELSADGSLMAVVIDKGMATELQVIDLATSKPRAFSSVPKGLISQLRWRPGSREIGFTLGSIKAQGDVYSLDTSLGTLTRWTASETTFNPDVLPAPELIEWKSFDGQAISGIIYRPASRFQGPRPVMVQIHGGPDQVDRVVFRGRSNYLLNELGVAIIYPNYRGSIGFGRKFQELDNGRGREGAIKDIGALLDWIATKPDLDKNRVVLNGVSYGGWLALQAGIVYNDRIRGVIEGAGMTDLVTYLEQTLPSRQENRRAEFGDERDPQTREYLKSISPVTRARDLKKPMLILHPGKDTRVPVAQAQEMVSALKANNAPVWYVEFTEANHDNLPGLGGTYLLASWMWFFQSFVLN